jgi:hypothetical protein
MNIIFSPVDSPTIKIRPGITVVNNSIHFYNFYKITTIGCPVSHILTLKSTRFIALYHDGVIHIFNLKDDNVFPDDFKKYIESIRVKLSDYYVTRGDRQLKSKREIIDDIDNKYEFVPIVSDYCREMEELDLKPAKEKIKELNGLLQETCPDFYLRTGYLTSFPENSIIYLLDSLDRDLNSFFTFPSIVLCLFTGNTCVSSISMHLNEELGVVYINSNTNVLYQRRQFNKLLRAVAIIISKAINPAIHTLTSVASNPTSASIMINSFNATCIYGSKSTRSQDEIDEVIKRSYNLQTHVELNDANIENAKRVFMEIIKTENKDKRIKCDKLQDETVVPVEAATAPPLAPADAHIAHPLDPAAAPPLDPAAAPPLDPAAALTITPPPLPPQPPSRSNYYRTLGIPPRVPRGGKQTKKRSGHKRSNDKRSNDKRSNHKRSNHKRSNHKRSNHKRSNHKRSGHKRELTR